ncbi:hypothetical protein CH373_02335 [Leptospira perolatii]|uniref:Uncharacterized protein n=1 Tax=Leptospira perolatii TaxID=2023191 RepID=A0A2M9ZS30_9LEPT|nr:hypothetical protein CH360_02335 [Leptospira perolatii]PJZ74890.1 hypothetical protein CH373_02335 [Leptospira perolatii]
MLDTPGMREVQLWSDGSGLETSFPEITEAAERYKFKDCTHNSELGRAVQAAISNGKIALDRFRSYTKLKAELLRSQMSVEEAVEKAEGKRKIFLKISKVFRQGVELFWEQFFWSFVRRYFRYF